MTRLATILGAISAVACAPYPDPAPNAVVQVTLQPGEPDGGARPDACAADNHCVMTAHVCLLATDPNPSATATLHLSSGTWLIATEAADPTSADVTPGPSCVDAPFRVGTAMGPVLVQASVGGFSNSDSANLLAAPVGEITLVSTPLLIEPDDAGTAATFSIQATALPLSPALALSDGTRLEFAVSGVVPAGERVVVDPDVAILDEAGAALTSVIAGAAVTSFTLQAKAVAADGTDLLTQSDTIDTGPP
jgi:hypothetical protein